MERFTKNEDRAIIDAYLRNGFHLTHQALEEVSEVTGRTQDAVRNRMSRYILPKYPNTLKKDFHIRIFLSDNLTRAYASHNPEAYHNVLVRTADMFMLNKEKFLTDFESSKNIYWGKDYLNMKGMPDMPDTFKEFVVNFIAKEDADNHLFDDLIMEFCTEESEAKQSWFRRLVNWIKNLFK